MTVVVEVAIEVEVDVGGDDVVSRSAVVLSAPRSAAFPQEPARSTITASARRTRIVGEYYGFVVNTTKACY